MLDINHPQTKHVQTAYFLQEEIRDHLLEWEMRGGMSGRHECHPDVVTTLIPQLESLNAMYFDNSEGIRRLLEELDVAIRERDCDASWRIFVQLAEQPGDNFGTWAL